MIRDALLYLTEKILNNNAPQKVAVEEPKDRSTFIMPDGELKVVEGQPQPIEVTCLEVESFAAMCKKYKAERVVFGDSDVWAAIDREGRESLRLPTPVAPDLHFLLSTINAANNQDQGISPRELTFRLKTDLRGCFTDEGYRESLVDKFGKLKTVTLEGGERQHSRSQDTMGETIDRQVSGDIELPEEIITFRPRVLNCPDLDTFRGGVEVYCQPNL